MILMMIFRPKGILPPPTATFNLDFLSALGGGGK
jgi:branched-chain amino acid transport system permease protein